MYHHSGVAWAVAAQFVFRLHKRSKERHPCHEVYEHQVQGQERALAFQSGYGTTPKVLDDRMAAT
eukprot:1292521-Karenia_brevis.AAC.1